jgi:hypothetical protein
MVPENVYGPPPCTAHLMVAPFSPSISLSPDETMLGAFGLPTW